MQQIQDFAAAVNEAFTAIGTSVDATVASSQASLLSIQGVAADVTALKAKIDEMNNSAGTLSPEDTATFADIVAKAGVLQSKTSSAAAAAKANADAIKALDDATTPDAVSTP